MKFSVTQLRKKTYDGPFVFNGTLKVSDLVALNNDIRKAYPATIEGSCHFQGDEIVFHLTIKGTLILPCARTLADVRHTYSLNVVEIFSTSVHYGEEEEENDIHKVEGELIDLTPYIKENIILNLPFRVYSQDEETIKQAVFEGEGWELTTEEEFAKKSEDVEQEEKIDPRLKKLKTLLEDKDK